jgi:hypothetical protein
VSKNTFLFPKSSPFGSPTNHITMIQNQQEFKIQINNVP